MSFSFLSIGTLIHSHRTGSQLKWQIKIMEMRMTYLKKLYENAFYEWYNVQISNLSLLGI
jgi:hypothetical protein